MDFGLSAAQAALVDEIEAFGRTELSPGAEQRDRDAAFPRGLWRRCGERRLQGLPLPASLGGLGLDPLSCALALEALGRGCADGGLVFALGAHLCACAVPIWRWGTAEQKQRWLPGLGEGRLVACHAMTEPGSGSDAFAMLARAEPDGAGFRLRGVKVFASNAPVADLALVFALTDPGRRFFGGVTAFLVETGTPGVTRGAPVSTMGLRTCPLGELALDDVRVGPEAVLGGVGGGAAVFAHSMDWERTLIFASHVGTAQRLLDVAAGQLRAAGPGAPAAQLLAGMAVRVEASRWLVRKAAWGLDRPGGATREASLAKLCASQALVRTALDVLQVLGEPGYRGEAGVERALRDAVASTLYSGTSEMQRLIVARLTRR